MIDRQILGTGRIPGPIGRKELAPFQGASRVVRRQKPVRAIPRPLRFLGTNPTRDGEVRVYDVTRYAIFWLPNQAPSGIQAGQPTTNAERSREPRQGKYKVIYVNGQEGNPDKHRVQSCALAVVSGGAVIGVYNASDGGVVSDTLKSVWLKMTSFALMKRHVRELSATAAPAAVEESMRARMADDCPAAASLFSLLLQPDFADARIVGHSQGNIIICNVINALIACRGESAVDRMHVIAVASPTVFWEYKKIVHRYNMSNDMVGWLSLDAPTLNAAYGGWSGETRDDSQQVVAYERSFTNRLTHTFYLYLTELWKELRPIFP